MRFIERARAKVNLSLHILGRYQNGWHELESLVAFAGVADILSLETGPSLSLIVEGPNAEDAGPINDNLVLRAARHLNDLYPGLRLGNFRLVKKLPAAAGLGGGSSDAAAALRLLARANDLSVQDARLREAALKTGADVPVCLESCARMMKGVGEQLGPPLVLPPLYAVLANPRVALETRSVFQKLGLAPGASSPLGSGPVFEASANFSQLLASLREARNDMEPAARSLEGAVTETLDLLNQMPGILLVRMSGSGATCFGLFETRKTALHAASAISALRPSWWVEATILR